MLKYIESLSLRQVFGYGAIILFVICFYILNQYESTMESTMFLDFLMVIWITSALGVKISWITNKYWPILNIISVASFIACLIAVKITYPEPAGVDFAIIDDIFLTIWTFIWVLGDLIDLDPFRFFNDKGEIADD